MSALPLEVRAAAAVVLLVSIVRAFRGPSAEEPRPVLARRLVFAACALQAATVPAIIAGWSVVAATLAALGVEAACFALWLGLSDEPPDDDGGDGDDDAPPPEEPSPDIDWDAFDRARGAWDRPRIGA
jgi:hypothetical protein